MEKPSSPEPSLRIGWRARFRRRRLKHVALLPTLLTLGNGVCGMLAILLTGEGIGILGQPKQVEPDWGTLQMALSPFGHAALFILVAMIFDALDGQVARLTRTASAFGAQLDSLCDLVTFAIAPAFLMYGLCHQMKFLPERVIMVVAVFYAMCGLLRLGRFTVETSPDDKSHHEFAGLPSPAAAGVIASAVIPWQPFENWPVLVAISKFLLHALPIMAFVLGVLMVSRIRYIHIVNKLFRGFRPFVVLVELALLAVLVVLFHEFALFVAFLTYALIGPILWIKARLFRRAVSVTPPSASTERDETLF